MQNKNNKMKLKSSLSVSIISLIFIVSCGVEGQRTVLDAQPFRPLFRSVKESIYSFISSRSSDGAFEFNRRAGVKFKISMITLIRI